MGEHRHHDGDENVSLTTYYRILACRGCGGSYFQTESFFSEDIEHRYLPDGGYETYMVPEVRYFPSPIRRKQPIWKLDLDFRDFNLGGLLSDVYGCLDANLPIPAAIATRTTFDRASELLGVETSFSFERKLTALVNMGKISPDERDILEVLVDAGSAAAHRGWKPKPAEIDTLVSLIEAFLHRAFVLGEAARQLKAVVPARPSRPPRIPL